MAICELGVANLHDIHILRFETNLSGSSLTTVWLTWGFGRFINHEATQWWANSQNAIFIISGRRLPGNDERIGDYFLHTNYMPIYNHLSDIENEFIEKFTTQISGNNGYSFLFFTVFFYSISLTQTSSWYLITSSWHFPNLRTKLAKKNERETVKKVTNTHSLCGTIINYSQYRVLFEKHAKIDAITRQWNLTHIYAFLFYMQLFFWSYI